jgi:hypothetical protein
MELYCVAGGVCRQTNMYQRLYLARDTFGL